MAATERRQTNTRPSVMVALWSGTDECTLQANMKHNCIICFRLDDSLDRRISRVLGCTYSTRSGFIRAAIEQALVLEEGRARLKAAHSAIEWS
jgi:hypothetical protein